LADPDLRRFVLLSLPFIAGMGMAFANEVFFRVFAQFLPAGALASLNYGLRLTMMLEGVFGQAIAVAAFPYLSQLARENKREQMCRLSGSVIQKICAAVLPLSGIALPLTPQILAVLFQRGAFSAASTSATAPVLAMYLIGAFAFAANAIVLRNFYAVQNTLFPMIVSSIAAALSLPIYWALGHAMGAPGIALATSLSIIAQFLFLYIAWSKRENDLAGFGAVIARIGQMFAITAAGAGVCAAIKWSILAWLPLPAAPLLRNIAVGVGAAAPSLAATLAIFHMTGLANIRDIANAVLRRRTHTPQQA
jgi:putative peptidoglycan lipid II flippase